MASYPPLPDGSPPMGTAPFNPQGPLMTIQDWAALASAPRRPAGTEVSMRATPVGALAGIPDHMFVRYDDGQQQLIARGGPTEGFGPGFFTPRNRVAAEVTPETSSKDYGASYRTIAKRFLPGVSADQAAAPARAHALGVDHFGNRYTGAHNSNSYAADVAEPMFGRRVGDGWTVGYQNSLRDGGAPPPSIDPIGRPRGIDWLAPFRGVDFTGPLNSDDLTPIIRNPPY